MIFCDPKAKPVLTARNVNKESGILSGFQGIVSHDQFGMAALSAGGMYAPNICHPWFKAFESLKKKNANFTYGDTSLATRGCRCLDES